MATRFAQQFIRTGARQLVRQFGESITYYQRGYLAGPGRSIQGIVERNVNIPSESGEQVATYLTIRVLDDSTYGISASEVDDGLDSIGVSLNTGGTAEVRTISRVIDDANGLLRLLIR